MSERIAIDRIKHEYSMVSDEKRDAVTSILHADMYMLASTCETADAAELIIRANAFVVLQCMLVIVGVCREEYGNIWVEELKSKLSQMA